MLQSHYRKDQIKINRIKHKYFHKKTSLLNNILIQSEKLNRSLENHKLSRDECVELFHEALVEPKELFLASQEIREKIKKKYVTFSKKVFLNLISLCRDSCSYCTYKAEPNESKLSMMSKKQIIQLLDLAKKYRCVEVLFVTGERPEERYDLAREWLKDNGFSSTAEYLIHASEMTIEAGLFPHTNAGNLEFSEMKEMRKTNVSMGLMLENASERMTEKNMPHHMAASKRPKTRLKVLENAGRLKIPMTTGILLGIGETPEETIDSIFAIKELHQKYGNIQEVILQNFQPKPDTRMNNMPAANEKYFKVIVALSRLIMPEMNIQIPPNLSPKSYQQFLKIGINDWGGISPLTQDYVNPEFAWPNIDEVEKHTRQAGFSLNCRFPVYPEFFHLISKELRDKMELIENEEGLVKEGYWR